VILGRHHLLLQVVRVGVRRQEGAEPEILLRLLLLRLEGQDLVEDLVIALKGFELVVEVILRFATRAVVLGERVV